MFPLNVTPYSTFHVLLFNRTCNLGIGLRVEICQIFSLYSEKNTWKRHLIAKFLLSYRKSWSLNLMTVFFHRSADGVSLLCFWTGVCSQSWSLSIEALRHWAYYVVSAGVQLLSVMLPQACPVIMPLCCQFRWNLSTCIILLCTFY